MYGRGKSVTMARNYMAENANARWQAGIAESWFGRALKSYGGARPNARGKVVWRIVWQWWPVVYPINLVLVAEDDCYRNYVHS